MPRAGAFGHRQHHRETLIEAETPLLHAFEERGRHGDLGGAGHGERHVAVEEYLPATIEVHRGHANPAPALRGDRGDLLLDDDVTLILQRDGRTGLDRRRGAQRRQGKRSGGQKLGEATLHVTVMTPTRFTHRYWNLTYCKC